MNILRFFWLLIPIVNGVVIDCEFGQRSWAVIGGVYICKLNSNPSITSSGNFITEANGNHLPSMSHHNVTGFDSYQVYQIINFMPRGLTAVFPNLFAISIMRGRINELHQDDLKEYTKLQYLYLRENGIKTLEQNLFKFNPELKLLSLSDNKINQVHPGAFDNLNQLEELRMCDNVCVAEDEAKNRSTVVELVKKVKYQCGPYYSIMELKHKINNCDQHCANLQTLLTVVDAKMKKIEDFESTIAELKQQNDEKSAKIRKLETSLEENEEKIKNLQQQNDEKFSNIEKQILELKDETNNKIRENYSLIIKYIN